MWFIGLTRIVFAVLSVTIQLSRFCFRSGRDFTSPAQACQGPRDKKYPKPFFSDFGSSDRQVLHSGLWRKTVSSIVSDLPILGEIIFRCGRNYTRGEQGVKGKIDEFSIKSRIPSIFKIVCLILRLFGLNTINFWYKKFQQCLSLSQKPPSTNHSFSFFFHSLDQIQYGGLSQRFQY